nr:unnamed protein product [Callosobruchus analis]
MASASDVDPFQSSGSEYIPSDTDNFREISSSSSEEQDDNEHIFKNHSRKRKRCPSQWIRNKQKLSRARGEAYKSMSTGKVTPERKQGANCNCAKDCVNKLSELKKRNIIVAFNNLTGQDKQDSYLSSLIKVCSISRRRNRNVESRRQLAYKYKVLFVNSSFYFQ